MSTHWYRRDGSTCYTVKGAKGQERDTTLADARKLGLVPSVTTVLQVIAKEQLITWMVNQGILAALTTSRRVGESDEDLCRRILTDSRDQAKKAAEEGTRVHDAFECSFKKGRTVPFAYEVTVNAMLEELARMYPGITDWESEESFSSRLGYGGKIDLRSPSTGIIVDAKGKDGDFTEVDSQGKPKKLVYDQPQQLGAYRHGCGYPETSPGGLLFFSRTHPGKVKGEIISAQDMTDGFNVFSAALELWKAIKKFNPAY